MGGVAGGVVPFRGWKNTSQVMRTNVVKLKQQDPNCRWRLEQTVAPFNDIVQTLQQQEQGLEKPESHWVELSEYLKEFPAPEENAIVYEWVNGSRIADVNVLTGRKGWHKRVDRSTSTVRRVTDLSDKTCDWTQQALLWTELPKQPQSRSFQNSHILSLFLFSMGLDPLRAKDPIVVSQWKRRTPMMKQELRQLMMMDLMMMT
jgi:hypothetical protein